VFQAWALPTLSQRKELKERKRKFQKTLSQVRNPGSRLIHYVGPKAPWNGYETLPNCRHPARTAPICFRRIPS
jgi:hypothetical protein